MRSARETALPERSRADLRRSALLLNAARHMRAGQLVGRLRRLVPPAALAARLAPDPPPAYAPHARHLGVDDAPQSGRVEPPDVDGVFRAVGCSRPFGSPDFWTATADGLLFLFHLHGFAPLADYAAGPRSPDGDAFWARVTESWLDSFARPSTPAWHPYPTSLRVIAWSAALSGIDHWPSSLRERLGGELWRQSRYLRRCVEHDIGGNHVIKNAVAMVLGGATCGDQSLLAAGRRVLRRAVARQFLPDGGHEERSTSYHRVVVGDLRDAAAALERATGNSPEWLTAAIAGAERWLQALAGPGGLLPLLNDAWEGPALRRTATEAVIHLRESGYVVLRSGRDQAVLDVGRICPPHLPPHAHADVGSFVLWADGAPVVVDPGAFIYTGPERNRFRGTAAHNTVEVDGEDQCVFWGDFRAGRQPRVGASPPRLIGDAVVVHVWHDGYGRLADPVRHERTFVWCPGDGLVVADVLRAKEPHRVRSSLDHGPRDLEGAVGSAGPLRVMPLGLNAGVDARPGVGAYAPHLGAQRPSRRTELRAEVGPGDPFGWSLLRAGATAEILTATELVVRRSSGRPLTIPLGPR